MLWRRSASLTRMTRRSSVIARSILRDVGAEQLADAFLRDGAVLEDVVEETGGDRRIVELHLRERHGDRERVDEIRLAGGPELVAVLVRRDDVGAAQQVLVHGGVVGLDLFEDVLEAQHGPIIAAYGPFRLISAPPKEPRWIS